LRFAIDASVIVGLAFDEAPSAKIGSVIDELEASEALTPSLFFFEVRNALVINEKRGRITRDGSTNFLRRLTRLPIRIAPLPEGAVLMELARKQKLTVYDAAYLELAKRERLPLATLDRALEKAAIAEGVALFGA
jgi:predicted nucleic acid-binding protein